MKDHCLWNIQFFWSGNWQSGDWQPHSKDIFFGIQNAFRIYCLIFTKKSVHSWMHKSNFYSPFLIAGLTVLRLNLSIVAFDLLISWSGKGKDFVRKAAPLQWYKTWIFFLQEIKKDACNDTNCNKKHVNQKFLYRSCFCQLKTS